MVPPLPMPPARNAPLKGCHMSRSPGPLAGMIPIPSFPIATTPPALSTRKRSAASVRRGFGIVKPFGVRVRGHGRPGIGSLAEHAEAEGGVPDAAALHAHGG